MLDRATWVVLVVLPLALFAQVWNFDFVSFDDQVYVTGNEEVQKGLTWETIRWSFTTLRAEFYHPLTWMTLMMDREFYFEFAGGYHLTNVLLHTTSTLLLFLALRRMTGAHWRSAMVAALFAIHPLHVESVAWVAERKDVLSTCFGFAALYSYARYVEQLSWKWYAATLLWFGCSLLSKSTLVTLPCLLLVLDWWPLRRYGWHRPPSDPSNDNWLPRADVSLRRAVLEKLPMLLMAALSCYITMRAQRPDTGVSLHEFPSFGIRCLNTILVYGLYLKQMVWPLGLACYYPHPNTSINLLHVAISGVMLLGVTGLCCWQLRRRPYLLGGWLWYLGVLFPVSGIVPIGGFQMADRYTYISLNGVFIMLVWGVAEILPRRRAGYLIAGVGSAIVLAALSAVTWSQIKTWRNTEDLFAHARRVTEPNVLTLNLAAVYQMEQGNLDQAEELLFSALEIREAYFPTYENFCSLEEQRGHPEKSIEWARRGVAAQPGWSRFYFRAAMLSFRIGDYQQGIQWLDDGRPYDPNLALRLANSGLGGDALRELQSQADASRADPLPHILMAGIYRHQAKREPALRQLSMALALDPDSPQALDEQEKMNRTDFNKKATVLPELQPDMTFPAP